ncbi:MAG TPA: 2-amino-4-hydroxy-6-hydroxymethyldihydropteridine diphosphokinase [Bauldia sp.]
MSVTALLSLGGNLGDRRALMDDAVLRLTALPETRMVARSAYYRTAPVGPIEQPWYLNIAIELSTGLSRAALVRACRVIEAHLGRDRSKEFSWGPRTMDIDVVAYGPVDEIDDRAFVLMPLAEITPDFPVGDATIGALAAGIDVTGVERLDWQVPDTKAPLP